MIQTVEQLRQLYPAPKERAVRKQLARLDHHCQRFIELSPFVVIATGSETGLDASPRGGDPGFARIIDDTTLWIPDSPGNNRLDSLVNIIETGKVGLIFFIPGVDETLRINGAAQVLADEATLQAFSHDKRLPNVVVQVAVQEAYLHCAKALMRSRLWSDESRRDRSVLPTMGQMILDQTGGDEAPESQQDMLARYQRDL